MRPLVLALLLLNILAVLPVKAAPVLPTQTAQPTAYRSCGQGFGCESVRVQLCIKKPHGRNIWILTRRDARLRRGVSTTDCTGYAVGLKFTLRYNGRQAAVQKHSLKCAVQVQRSVSVALKACYSVVQTNAQKRFADVVAGTRVCVRSLGSRGRGCHEDYAINIYAHADGRLTGETWVGFKLYVPKL